MLLGEKMKKIKKKPQRTEAVEENFFNFLKAQTCTSFFFKVALTNLIQRFVCFV